MAGAIFWTTTSRGFTKEQLYSTASYKAKNLRGIELGEYSLSTSELVNDLSGWNFSQQDLTGANFNYATLNGADFAGANLANATLRSATLTNTNLTVRR